MGNMLEFPCAELAQTQLCVSAAGLTKKQTAVIAVNQENQEAGLGCDKQTSATGTYIVVELEEERLWELCGVAIAGLSRQLQRQLQKKSLLGKAIDWVLVLLVLGR